MRVTVDKIVSCEHIPALERLCENTKDKELFLHAQALILRSQGKTLKQIREALGVPEATVKFYTKRLKQEGIAGLSYHEQSGNHTKLNKAQWKELRILLASTEAWPMESIKCLLAMKFGVKYAHSHSYVQLIEKAGYFYEPVYQCYITPKTYQQYKEAIEGTRALEREFARHPLDYVFKK